MGYNKPMREVAITIEVNGRINQTIAINRDCHLSMEEIKAGFKDGSIVSSVGHGDNNGRVYHISIAPAGLVEIGKVSNQEACDDFEIEILI